MDLRSRDGYSVDELKSTCSIEVITPFSRFRVARREDCISPEQDYPEFLFQEKGQSGGRKKAQKADRFLRRRQISYLIYENFRVTGVDDSVLDYADFFSVVLRNYNIHEFDTR